MESSTINPDSEENKTPRRRAAGEQFGRWFPDMMPDHLKDKTEKDDDDDEEETDDNGNPKPKHATLKSIFSVDKPETPVKELSLLDRMVVKKPEATSAEEAPETVDTTVSEAAEATEPELAAETAPEGVVLAEAGLPDEEPITETPMDTVAETPYEAPAKPAPEIMETSAEGGSQEPPEVPPSGEQATEPPDDEADDKRLAAATSVRGGGGSGSGPGSSGGRGGRAAGSRGAVPGAGGGVAAPTPDTIVIREHEKVIEHRGGGLAALALLGVGAEYFGRRRADRKLEHRTDKKLEAAGKQVAASEAGLRHQIEQLARKNREEVGQIKAQEQHFERQLQDRSKVKESAPKLAMAKENREQPADRVEKSPELAPVRPLLTPERRPKQQPERPAAASFERQAAAPPELVRAQEVLKKEPVEQIYELRHELKDNSALQIAAAAASAGPLLTTPGSVRPSPAAQPAVPYINPSRDRLHDDKRLQRTNPALYKQAMTIGLWGALMIIIFGLLVYFLVH